MSGSGIPLPDSGLRELERRFNTSGDRADEVAYLRAAEEAKVIGPEGLGLAAYVHHPAALELMGPQYRVHPKPPTDELVFDKLSGRWLESPSWKPTPPSPGEVLIGWATGLGTWGLEAELRAGLAYGYVILRVLERHVDHPTGDLVSFPFKHETLEALVRVNAARIDAVAAWVLQPAPATRRGVEQALNLPNPDRFGFLDADDGRGGSIDLRGWCDQLARVGEELSLAVTESGRVAFEHWWSAACTTDHAVLHRVQTLFGKALAPWALGYGDPLRARQAARLARTRPAQTCGDVPTRADGAGNRARTTRCACGQLLYDIRDMTPEEAEALVRARPEGKLAVRLYRREDGRLQIADCYPGLVRIARRTAPDLGSGTSSVAA